eukprot:3518743-Pleurochrysis_carterae.AAC.7
MGASLELTSRIERVIMVKTDRRRSMLHDASYEFFTIPLKSMFSLLKTVYCEERLLIDSSYLKRGLPNMALPRNSLAGKLLGHAGLQQDQAAFSQWRNAQHLHLVYGDKTLPIPSSS